MTGLICETDGCGTPLAHNPKRKTMLCKPCSSRRNAQCPERRRKCSEAMAKRYADPMARIEHGALMKEVFAEVRQRDPSFTEKKRENARRCGFHAAAMSSPKMVKGSEGRMKAGRKTSERHMGWCPPEYRADYRHLVYTKKFKKAEAKGIIKRQIAKDTEAYHRTGQLQRGKA